MNVVIINGHPDNNSFCNALAENYKLGTDRAGNVCHLIHLSNLKSIPNFKYGYNIQMELEPDLAELQKLINEANHLVFYLSNMVGYLSSII